MAYSKPKMAYSKPNFCMLLAKLPVESFNHIPFSNTKMGRELSIAEVKVNPDKSLMVATTHLESPCPGPPKWDQMYSKERVPQANESVNLLMEYPNVMVGTEEILGFLYCKEKKSKNGIKKLMLPVFPSDHYGLLVTITKV
ncbi:hypothetical protein V2J09_019317 [Rumex salicifolius]